MKKSQRNATDITRKLTMEKSETNVLLASRINIITTIYVKTVTVDKQTQPCHRDQYRFPSIKYFYLDIFRFASKMLLNEVWSWFFHRFLFSMCSVTQIIFGRIGRDGSWQRDIAPHKIWMLLLFCSWHQVAHQAKKSGSSGRKIGSAKKSSGRKIGSAKTNNQ